MSGEQPARRGPRGAQGNQGNRGEQGAAGLSSPVRRALVFMFALAVLLGALDLFWTAHEVHASQAAVQAAQVREQAMQRSQGQAIGRKLCATLGALAALEPPPGNPKTNPSRAYLQAQHDTLAQLGVDLDCKRGGS